MLGNCITTNAIVHSTRELPPVPQTFMPNQLADVPKPTGIRSKPVVPQPTGILSQPNRFQFALKSRGV